MLLYAFLLLMVWFLFPFVICGFVGTWMASQWPQVPHLFSHLGGLDPICDVNIALFSLSIYVQPKTNKLLSNTLVIRLKEKFTSLSPWRLVSSNFLPAKWKTNLELYFVRVNKPFEITCARKQRGGYLQRGMWSGISLKW